MRPTSTLRPDATATDDEHELREARIAAARQNPHWTELSRRSKRASGSRSTSSGTGGSCSSSRCRGRRGGARSSSSGRDGAGREPHRDHQSRAARHRRRPPQPRRAATRNPALPARLKLGRDFFRREQDDALLIDHDDDRPIGRVHDLFELEDVDGWWWAVRVTVDEKPWWLGRGTRASWRVRPIHRAALGHSERVLKGWIDQVSVLSPGVEPAEPFAQVMSLRESDEPAARSSPAVAPGGLAAGEVIYGNGQLVRRYFPTAITVR